MCFSFKNKDISKWLQTLNGSVFPGLHWPLITFRKAQSFLRRWHCYIWIISQSSHSSIVVSLLLIFSLFIFLRPLDLHLSHLALNYFPECFTVSAFTVRSLSGTTTYHRHRKYIQVEEEDYLRYCSKGFRYFREDGQGDLVYSLGPSPGGHQQWEYMV
jgi:hypothetical protein